ncbi:hypothetical protein [Streptomyces sp. NPDC003327]
MTTTDGPAERPRPAGSAVAGPPDDGTARRLPPALPSRTPSPAVPVPAATGNLPARSDV